jgi:Asp-tRNA(Asn)/Glu-tRNA(Gln) amidotransferase B subunit
MIGLYMTDEEAIKKHQMRLQNKTIAYSYIREMDEHLINLFHWISTLEDLCEEVRSTDRDHEAEKSIEELINKFRREVADRICGIFP